MDTGSFKGRTDHFSWYYFLSHLFQTGRLFFCLMALITATDLAFAGCSDFSPSANKSCCAFNTLTGPHPWVEVGSFQECLSIARPFADEIAVSGVDILYPNAKFGCTPPPYYTYIGDPVYIQSPPGIKQEGKFWYGLWCKNAYAVGVPVTMYSFEQNYRIQLANTSGSPNPDFLAEVEPWESINTLIATVYDSNNQPRPGVSVTLRAEVVPMSGGHSHHDDNRPMGDLGGTPPLGHILENQITGADGAVHFTFKAPKVAGDHMITANCNDRPCGSDTGKVWVGIRGLVNIPSSGFWNLIGDTAVHPAGHYLTGDAFGKLMDLAQLYTQVYFPFRSHTPVLQLNDASLVRGGVFDIDFVGRTTFWAPPHAEHQRGAVIDIQANGSVTAIPQRNFADFQALLRKQGMTWWPEYLNQSGGHYHVRLLGVAQ